MNNQNNNEVLDIRPSTAILGVYARYPYKAWTALAEFIDNSIQSFDDNIEIMEDDKVIVDIRFDSEKNRITIKDNAGGIKYEDFPRAFKTGTPPEDNSGLCEFGMGMKSAAIWFSKLWEVNTKVKSEDISRRVVFDVSNITANEIESLAVQDESDLADAHGTEIILDEIRSYPSPQAIGRIKAHLTNIYRQFIRDDRLELRWTVDDKETEILEPEVIGFLKAPFFPEPKLPGNGPDIEWKVPIDMSIGPDQRVTGYLGLLETSSRFKSGLTLFRRGRVIQGSAIKGGNSTDGFRPLKLCGPAGYPRSIRLYGELHLDGFEVSHSKDQIVWLDPDEDTFMEMLIEHLKGHEIGKDLLAQGDNYRVMSAEEQKNAIDTAVEDTANRLRKTSLWDRVKEAFTRTPTDTGSYFPNDRNVVKYDHINVKHEGEHWIVKLEVIDDDDKGDQWLSVSIPDNGDTNAVGIRVSASHPFMLRFASDGDAFNVAIKCATGLAIAEAVAKHKQGLSNMSEIRETLNDILTSMAEK